MSLFAQPQKGCVDIPMLGLNMGHAPKVTTELGETGYAQFWNKTRSYG